jgi:hypothetical protein
MTGEQRVRFNPLSETSLRLTLAIQERKNFF